MNKQDLILKVAKDADLSKSVAEKAVNTLIETIKASLKKGNKVILLGFGTFSVSKRKARKGRNPQTGEAIKIPARKIPRFTAGRGLKDSIK
jgi:DNA-binding protein HU-beta